MTATLAPNLENPSQQHNNVKGLQLVFVPRTSCRLLSGLRFFRMPLMQE